MSFEDSNCPCGGKKEPGTMLCQLCESELATHPSMPVFKDHQSNLELRRHAAIVLVTLARGRKRKAQP